ncbi:MAG: toll/interleukin-1 receptor domain-containing protein, partial [Chloroflexota bacterium]
MADKLKVFLCHASENKPIVNNLFDDLVAAGYEPWLDTEVLLPGMDWDLEIKKGMRASDSVIVCLSSISVSKEGYIQKELKFAQDIQDEKPRGTIFLIPLRLEPCETPYDLRDIQWAEYTAPDGFEKLVKGLNIRAKQLGK